MMLWASVMGFSAAVALYLRTEWITGHLAAVVAIATAGGAIAYAPSLVVLRLVATNGRPVFCFVSALLLFGTVTVGTTAMLYALVYRQFFAAWHGDTFTVLWLYQFVFTVLTALYQFAVLGLALYWPVGVVALVALAVHEARRAR